MAILRRGLHSHRALHRLRVCSRKFELCFPAAGRRETVRHVAGAAARSSSGAPASHALPTFEWLLL